MKKTKPNFYIPLNVKTPDPKRRSEREMLSARSASSLANLLTRSDRSDSLPDVNILFSDEKWKTTDYTPRNDDRDSLKTPKATSAFKPLATTYSAYGFCNVSPCADSCN